jgi:hypothetical protein
MTNDKVWIDFNYISQIKGMTIKDVISHYGDDGKVKKIKLRFTDDNEIIFFINVEKENISLEYNHRIYEKINT